MNTQKFTLRDNDRAEECLTGWLSVPSLPVLLNKKAKRMMKRVKAAIQPCTLIVYGIDRISNPPRKFTVNTFRIESEDRHLVAHKTLLSTGEIIDWQNVCALMSPIGEEIISRWPEKARPDGITLISDGSAIWFNPDYPQGTGMEWLQLHLNGNPCAIIHNEETHRPLSREWIEDR